MRYHLSRGAAENLSPISQTIRGNAGRIFTRRAADALLAVLDAEMLARLRDHRIFATFEEIIPPQIITADGDALTRLGDLVARIIDYKSAFTRRHTASIAQRASRMAEFYRYDLLAKQQIYLAASLHDLGKLATPTAILEKTGKLDAGEFAIIKEHVRHTYEMLTGVEGLEQIREWAAGHHEKLDGAGYPFGKRAEAMDFNTRLLACIDIYQAVSEERPYHPARSHAETMPILFAMAEKGAIDAGIVRDMDKVMAEDN